MVCNPADSAAVKATATHLAVFPLEVHRAIRERRSNRVRNLNSNTVRRSSNTARRSSPTGPRNQAIRIQACPDPVSTERRSSVRQRAAISLACPGCRARRCPAR